MKSLEIYKPFIPYKRKSVLVEEYKCKNCPWNYFESWNEEAVTQIKDSQENIFNIAKKRIFFRCKNPEHEYLTCVEKS